MSGLLCRHGSLCRRPPSGTAPRSHGARTAFDAGLPLLYSLLRNSAAWTERKRKNFVICLDGTSNAPDQVEKGFTATTNVYKPFRMLKSDAEGMFQPGKQFDASLCKGDRNGQSQQIALPWISC